MSRCLRCVASRYPTGPWAETTKAPQHIGPPPFRLPRGQLKAAGPGADQLIQDVDASPKSPVRGRWKRPADDHPSIPGQRWFSIFDATTTVPDQCRDHEWCADEGRRPKPGPTSAAHGWPARAARPAPMRDRHGTRPRHSTDRGLPMDASDVADHGHAPTTALPPPTPRPASTVRAPAHGSPRSPPRIASAHRDTAPQGRPSRPDVGAATWVSYAARPLR